jgi:hypothetical protein
MACQYSLFIGVVGYSWAEARAEISRTSAMNKLAPAFTGYGIMRPV